MSYLRIKNHISNKTTPVVYTIRWNNGAWKLFSPWSYADTGVFHTKNDVIRAIGGQFHR